MREILSNLFNRESLYICMCRYCSTYIILPLSRGRLKRLLYHVKKVEHKFEIAARNLFKCEF